MTTKSALEWPIGFTRRTDPFPQSSVSGTIGSPNSGSSTKPTVTIGGSYTGYKTATAPPTAGVKPTDIIVRKYTVINRVNAYYWENQTTGARYNADPRPPVSARDAATIYELTRTTFVKTSWLGLVFSGGGAGSTPAAVQLWIKKGTSINEEDASNAYVRRGGAFASKNGGEWFVTYDSIRGSSTRYAPRKIGLPYRNDAAQLTYQNEVLENFGVNLQQAALVNFDWVNGTWPPGTNQFGPLAAYLAANEVVTSPLDFGRSGTGSGSGRGNRGRDSGDSSVPDLPIPAITITTRMPKGYAGRAVGGTSRPQMVQRYQTEGNKYADETFIFRYIPQGIKYSGLGSNWVEIPRAEDIPFVDWASWQLMKVSFSFVIAADRTESGGAIVPDGLDISVDDQIEKLRKMAQRKVPVTLVNFDEMLTFQLRRGEKSTKGTNIYVKKPSQISGGPDERVRTTQPNMEFVIQDLSVTATRRTSQQTVGGKDKDGLKSASMLSMISVAQCEITLTEIPVETVGIIALPEITTPGLPPSKKKPPDSRSQKYEYITDIMASPSSAYNAYSPNDNIPNT
jgi:hypothetical protein